jgi:Flagellar hook-length control protein FliK
MTASFHSPIARAGLPTVPAEIEPAELESRERDRSDDAWALAITQALVEARPRLTLPSLSEEDAPPPAAAERPVSTVNAELATEEGTGANGAPASSTSATSASKGPPLPTKIITQLNDSRLGRMELTVARGASGLHIVINVADAHVKALIEAEQASLVKSLQGCGLSVDSVKIGSSATTGTALAPQEVAPERGLARSRGNPNLRPANASRRGYGAPAEEDPEDDAERVNLKA